MSEYSRLSACAQTGLVQSQDDALKLARDDARDWDRVRRYGIEIDPNPHRLIDDPRRANAHAYKDAWGFKHYWVSFSGPRGAELHITDIDQCGHYYPDSVLTMSPDPGP